MKLNVNLERAQGRDSAPSPWSRLRVFFSNNPLFRRIDWNLAAVLTIPFILLAANDEWLFPYGNPSDNWINVNYFFDTGHDYPPLYTLYKATRLSWIVKGYLAHTLLSPLAAHYVLHLTIFVAYIGVFYILIRRLLNPSIAFVGTVAFATYSQLHAVVSFEWDYQTHDGVLNLLLTLLLLMYAAESRHWRTWLILSGIAWVSALQTTYTGTYIPSVLFWYLYLNWKGRKNPIISSAGYVLIGALIAVFAYCLISYWLGGPFLFFESLIIPIKAFGFSSFYRFHIGYWQPIEVLLKDSKGMVLPLFISLLAALTLLFIVVQRRHGPALDSIRLLLSMLMVSFLTAVSYHSIGHGQLANDHMVAYMAPFVFMGLTGVYAFILRISGLTVPANKTKATPLKAAVFAMFCGALIFSGIFRPFADDLALTVQDLLSFPRWAAYWKLLLTLAVAIAFVAVTTLILSLRAWSQQAKGFIATLSLSGFIAIANVQTTSIDAHMYGVGSKCGFHKDLYQAVIDTFLRLRKFDPDYILRLWYRNNEFSLHPDSACDPSGPDPAYGARKINMTEIYGAVWGIRSFSIIQVPARGVEYDYDGLMEHYLSTSTFSSLAVERTEQIQPDFRAAILARDPADHATALQTLRSRGYAISILDRSFIDRGAVKFHVTIIRARKDDRALARSRLPGIVDD